MKAFTYQKLYNILRHDFVARLEYTIVLDCWELVNLETILVIDTNFWAVLCDLRCPPTQNLKLRVCSAIAVSKLLAGQFMSSCPGALWWVRCAQMNRDKKIVNWEKEEKERKAKLAFGARASAGSAAPSRSRGSIWLAHGNKAWSSHPAGP